MFSWLKSLYNGAVGKLSDIEKWIMGALNAVYSYFSGLVSQVWTGLQALGSAIDGYINQLWSSFSSLYTLVQYILTKSIPNVISWAVGELNKVRSYAIGVYNWAISQLGKLASWTQSLISDAIQWVLKNVWDPLWNDITGALKWIANEGAYVYYLLTHPDVFAKIAGEYILSQWINWGKRFAKPFVNWLLHNMLSELPTVGSVIEDIIASLF